MIVTLVPCLMNFNKVCDGGDSCKLELTLTLVPVESGSGSQLHVTSTQVAERLKKKTNAPSLNLSITEGDCLSLSKC